MKDKSLFLLGLFLILIFGSFTTSNVLNDNLLNENQALKEELAQVESCDSSKIGAIVELSKMNVVYRGINNPIKIAMPNAVTFEASAPGLKKIDDLGNYTLAPGKGLTVDINIVGTAKNGNTITDKKTLRVIDIGRLTGTFNGEGCRNCKLYLDKNEVRNGVIDVRYPDFIFDLDFRVYVFKVQLPNGNTIEVKGNTFDKEAKLAIDSLMKGDNITIYDIRPMCLGQSLKMPIASPVDIEIK